MAPCSESTQAIVVVIGDADETGQPGIAAINRAQDDTLASHHPGGVSIERRHPAKIADGTGALVVEVGPSVIRVKNGTLGADYPPDVVADKGYRI
jgi:hypothetical protein